MLLDTLINYSTRMVCLYWPSLIYFMFGFEALLSCICIIKPRHLPDPCRSPQPKMSQTAFALPLLLGTLCTLLFIFRATFSRLFKRQSNDRKLPPGPPGLPIIGNLHMLGKLPHQTLWHLAKKYGPIMSLRMGSVPAVVVSSPEAAELFLKTHDLVFASRPYIQASAYMSYGRKNMIFAEYGSYWRDMRKLCTLHLLSASKIESFAPLRKKQMGLLVESLKKAAAAREVVDLSAKISEIMEDLIYEMILGFGKGDKYNLKAIFQESANLQGAFNISDFVPFLAPLDLQGFSPKLKTLRKALDEILEKIIDEHERTIQVQHRSQPRDFVDVFLSLLNESQDDKQAFKIDRTNIKAVLLDMIGAAIDTSANSIDWTLVELIRNPQAMMQLQEELKRVVGLNRMVEETDLSKLTYLDMVLKESFRLHPVGPLLIHESREDITLKKHHIPKKSRVLVNVWGIGRDPNVWSDNVGDFIPDRFVGSNMDFGGRDNFKFIPFGSGRRGCPGMQMGLTSVRSIVAQLVHCFDWKLPGGMSPNEMDMSETFGLTLPRADHLFAKPTFRLS